MTYSYYPGCTLKTKAKDLDIYARKSAQALNITLEEIPDWQCCGGVYSLAQDEIATKLSAVRALTGAKQEGRALLTLCSACHHVIKRVNNDIRTNEEIRNKANNYLKLETEYTGETNVIHYLEMLRDTVGFDELKKAVKKPLTGIRIAAYYGCLLLRPSSVMQFDNAENPSIIEDFIKAVGATPVIYPYRNECCGGYVILSDKELAQKKCETILDSASLKGADMIITACPLCMFNLDSNNQKHNLPIYYFTEVLAEVLGLKDEEG